jgi:hypothetical protein
MSAATHYEIGYTKRTLEMKGQEVVVNYSSVILLSCHIIIFAYPIS